MNNINSKIVSNVEKECQIFDFPVEKLSKLSFAD